MHTDLFSVLRREVFARNSIFHFAYGRFSHYRSFSVYTLRVGSELGAKGTLGEPQNRAPRMARNVLQILKD